MQWQKENHIEWEWDNFSRTGRIDNLCFSLSRTHRAKTRSEIVSNPWSSSDLSAVDRVCQSLERVAKNNSRHRGKQISPPTRPAAWQTSGETGGEKEKRRVSSSKCTKVRWMWLPFKECSKNSWEHQFICRRIKDPPLKGVKKKKKKKEEKTKKKVSLAFLRTPQKTYVLPFFSSFWHHLTRQHLEAFTIKYGVLSKINLHTQVLGQHIKPVSSRAQFITRINGNKAKTTSLCPVRAGILHLSTGAAQ